MTNAQPRLVITARFITSLAYYMIIPFLAYFLMQLKDMSSVQAGLVIAMLNVSRRCCGIGAGYVCGRLGSQKTFLAGIMLEGLSYSGLAIADGFSLLLSLATLVGVGGSLMNVSARVMLAHHARAQESFSSYSAFYVIMHIGALCGPLLTAVLMERFDPSFIFYFTAATYAGLIVFMIRAWPSACSRSGGEESAFFANVRHVCRDIFFVKFCIAIVGSWFLSTQIFISFPMYLLMRQIDASHFSFYVACNACLIIVLQYPLGKFLQSKKAETWQSILWLGSLIMSSAWLLGAFPLSLAGWLCVILLFTIGEILFIAAVDPLTAHYASAGRTAEYIGFAMCSWGIGAGMCGLLSGFGLRWAQQHALLNQYWAFIAGIGFIWCYFLSTIRLTDTEVAYANMPGHGARCSRSGE